MNLRSLLLIVLALVLVGGTVFFAKNWLESQRARVVEAPKPEPKKVTEVLVAKDALLPSVLQASHPKKYCQQTLALISWSRSNRKHCQRLLPQNPSSPSTGLA